jgi:flavodoxin
MNALVIYDSQFGNTERIARTITGMLSEFGQARAIHIDQTQPIDFQGVDLLIIGCPTQGRKPTPAMQSFLENVSPKSLSGLAVVCFDTRIRGPLWIWGSAAKVMDTKLREMGTLPTFPPESFLVTMANPPLLVNGEVERAAKWARILRETIEAPHPAAR